MLRRVPQVPLLRTDTAAAPSLTTPMTPTDYVDTPDTNLTDWLVSDFDDQVGNSDQVH